MRVSDRGCGITLKSEGDEYPTGGWFPEIPVSELRPAFNEAMRIAVAHYTDCVAKAEVELTPARIMEVSFPVVLSAMAARWAQSRVLSFEIADLRADRARHRCWNYCQTKFGAGHRRYAAALMNMNLQQLDEYERLYRG